MDIWNKYRTENALFLYERLKDLPILRIPMPNENLKHAWYKFYAYLNTKAISSKWNRNLILEEINKKGYQALTGSCSEIYLEKCFKDEPFLPLKRLPIAKELGETSIMFQIHPSINSNEMEDYCNTIDSIFKKASLS